MHDSGDKLIGSGSSWKITGSTASSFITVSTSISGYTTGAHQTHYHGFSYSFDTTYNGSSTDQESRPDNFTIKIWKRIS